MAKSSASPAPAAKSAPARKGKGKPAPAPAAPVAVEATEAPAPVAEPVAEPVAVAAEATEAPAPLDAARTAVAAAYLSGGIPAAWAALAAANLDDADAALLGAEIRALDAPPAAPAPVTEAAPVVEAEPPPAPAPVRWRVTYGATTVEVPANGDPMTALDPLVAASGAPFDASKLTVTDLDAPPPAVEAPAEPPAPVVEAAPAPVPAPAPVMGERAEVVDAAAAARIAAARKAVAAAGLAYGETWFADGTVLYNSGTESVRRSLAEVSALPLASTALLKLAARVRGEDRRDLAVTDVSEVRMDSSGALIVPGSSDLIRPEVGAWQALAARCGVVLTEPFMRARDLANPAPVVAALAATFNAWQGQIKAERDALNGKAKSAVLGFRDVDGERRLYRVVSDRYARDIDIASVADLVAEVLAADGLDPHTDVAYDGSRVQVDLTFPTNVDAGAFGVGEMWKVQIRVRSADDGSGGLGVVIGLHFARCRNFSQSTTETSVMARRHLGDSGAIAQALRAAIRDAHVRVQPLIAAWGAAKSDNLIDALPASSPVRGSGVPIEEALPGFFRSILATREAVPVLSSRATPRLVEAWKQDDGPGGSSSGIITRAGVVNAMTRYAHTEADPWDRAGIERLASAYLDPTRQIGWLPEKSRAKG